MAYRMTELTPRVRIGTMSNGCLDIEVWEVDYGWKTGVSEFEQLIIPNDAVDDLFEYLR